MGEVRVPSVLGALRMARKALVENHNVLATDRPDLERASDTGWTTDFRKEIDAIDAAIEMLVGCPCLDARLEAAKSGLEASSDRLSRAWSAVLEQTPDSVPPVLSIQERGQSSIPPTVPTWRRRLNAALVAWKRGVL